MDLNWHATKDRTYADNIRVQSLEVLSKLAELFQDQGEPSEGRRWLWIRCCAQTVVVEGRRLPVYRDGRMRRHEVKMRVWITITGFITIVGLVSFTWAGSADTSPAGQFVEVRLPTPETTGGMSLTEGLAKRRSVRSFTDRPLSMEEISQLCWAAQGITQQERGLRTAPSALALYPLHIFVVEKTRLSEYLPQSHALRLLADGNMLETLRTAVSQPPVASAALCIILAMDVQHMVPKCGDRAERYCLLESGHIAQNVLLQATALGLASVPVGGIDEAKVAGAMKLPAGLRPVYLLPIGHPKPN